MLTQLEAYSSWKSAPTLPLSDNGREETDLIQVRNITGLDPVKAAVNTSSFGSVDGAAYIGSNVASRNIVLTLHPNPDWNTWTFESLRRLIYTYFMPKLLTRLVFRSNDIPPVEIYGYVEDVSVTQFAKDVEIQVSIICPDPYFTAVDPVIVAGRSWTSSEYNRITIDYKGSIETGFNVKLTQSSGNAPNIVDIQVGTPTESEFRVETSSGNIPILDSSNYLVVNSIAGQRYVQNVSLATGVITNLLPKVRQGSQWVTLRPGQQTFAVLTYGISPAGVQDYTLTYFERYGGL